MENMKLKMVLLTPVLIKSSAYILMGVGGAANALGYNDVGGVLLGIAALFGLKDAATTVSTQQ